MLNFEEVVRLNYTIVSGNESYSLYFNITVIDGTQIISNTMTFSNVGLSNQYGNAYYEDLNGIGFSFNDIKRSGSGLIMSTYSDSQVSVDFPNGLISFSFKYLVRSRRPLDLNINISKSYPFNNYFVDKVVLANHIDNQVYTYQYDGSSYLSNDIFVLLFLNTNSGLFEIEILEFTYKAIKVN